MTYLTLMEFDLLDSGAMRIANLNNRFKSKQGSEGRPFVDKPAFYFQEKLQLGQLTPLETFYLYLMALTQVEMGAMRIANMRKEFKHKHGSEGRPFVDKPGVYFQEEATNMTGLVENTINTSRSALSLGRSVLEHSKSGTIESNVDSADVEESVQALEDFLQSAVKVLNGIGKQ